MWPWVGYFRVAVRDEVVHFLRVAGLNELKNWTGV